MRPDKKHPLPPGGAIFSSQSVTSGYFGRTSPMSALALFFSQNADLHHAPCCPLESILLADDVSSTARVIQKCQDRGHDVWTSIRVPYMDHDPEDLVFARLAQWRSTWGFLEAPACKADVVILHESLADQPWTLHDLFREVHGTEQPFSGVLGVRAVDAALSLDSLKTELWHSLGHRVFSYTYQK